MGRLFWIFAKGELKLISKTIQNELLFFIISPFALWPVCFVIHWIGLFQCTRLSSKWETLLARERVLLLLLCNACLSRILALQFLSFLLNNVLRNVAEKLIGIYQIVSRFFFLRYTLTRKRHILFFVAVSGALDYVNISKFFF